jgi:hypothetical protein
MKKIHKIFVDVGCELDFYGKWNPGAKIVVSGLEESSLKALKIDIFPL